jgi:hypothetical protein
LRKSCREASSPLRAEHRSQTQKGSAHQEPDYWDILAWDCALQHSSMTWEGRVRCVEDSRSKTWFLFAMVNSALRILFDSPYQMELCHVWDLVSLVDRSGPIAWHTTELWLTRILSLSRASGCFQAKNLLQAALTNPKLKKRFSSLHLFMKTERLKKSSNKCYARPRSEIKKNSNERNVVWKFFRVNRFRLNHPRKVCSWTALGNCWFMLLQCNVNKKQSHRWNLVVIHCAVMI